MAFVSGIGCSSRFPHYVNSYGFHGIHGRALPIATGLKLARPELDVFVVMGDGDCTSIGAGHWIHATRYNTNMTVLLLDNNIYGLTKNQTSPTTPQGYASNTSPRGSVLPALDPLQTTLGVPMLRSWHRRPTGFRHIFMPPCRQPMSTTGFPLSASCNAVPSSHRMYLQTRSRTLT